MLSTARKSWTVQTGRRASAVLAAIALMVGGAMSPAVAAPLVSVTPTATTVTAAGTPTHLEGLSVTGDGMLSVILSTDLGTLAISEASGVTIAAGYRSVGSELSFHGDPAQVNAALGSATLTAPAGTAGQRATVELSAFPYDGAVLGPNGHIYEYVGSLGISWDDARSQASSRTYEGASGYLVTITSFEENDFVSSRIPGARNVWIGAAATEGVDGWARQWSWVDGPEAGDVISSCSNATEPCDFAGPGGYSAWDAPSEPNNYFSGESVAVTNWNWTSGRWNDLPVSGEGQASGYVVEYGTGSAFSVIATTSSQVTVLDVPSSPTAPAATPGSEQATVSFTGSGSDGGSAITGYTVTASPGGATATCASSPCTVTGLTAWQSYAFTVTATNGIGTSAPSVASAGTVVWPQPSAPSGLAGMATTPVVGSAYADGVSAAGFPLPTFAVTGGVLPAGLSLDPASGAVTGTPTLPGDYSVTVTATNSEGTTSRTFTGFVGQTPTAVVGDLGMLPIGGPVWVVLAADGFPEPTWSVTAGSLPAGLVLSGSTGAITGTPTAAGAYAVQVTATNAVGATSRTLTGDVVAPPGAIGGVMTAPVVGQPLSVTFTGDGHPAPTFTLTDGLLPAGLTLGTSGVLSGAPTAPGPYAFEVSAANDHGTVARTVTGYVGQVPVVTSGTRSLRFGEPASASVVWAGYPAPTFAVTDGSLPPGVTFDATSGQLTGTPTVVGRFLVEVSATNVHGTAVGELDIEVAPVAPGAPGGPMVTAGDGLTVATFDRPTTDGGTAVTGYEVSVDGGGWTSLATSSDGDAVTGTVTGLTNGTTYAVRVRAVNAVGSGPASAPASVRPIAPPPVPVAAPTALAGTSSVTVTWSASTERDVTGYTVVAEPGAGTCSTTDVDATSCVIGARAGVAVTYRVIVHSAWGDSVASAPSDAVTPMSPSVPAAPPTSAPATLTTTDGAITSVRLGQEITVLGTGFAPFSTAVVVMYSTPIVLGTVTTDAAGSFSLTVVVPTELEVGAHTLVALGVDAAGATYQMRLPVELPTAVPGGVAALAVTGASAAALGWLVALLVGLGAGLRLLAWRHTPVPAVVRRRALTRA